MSISVAIPVALGAAAFFAAGTALQYRAARDLDDDPTLSRRLDLTAAGRVARRSLSSRTWTAGTAILAIGLGLHVWALHEAPLTLVQPLLISGVLFALPASRKVGGKAVTRSDMSWAAVLVASLAAFLFTATPTSQSGGDIDGGPAAIVFGFSALGIAACLFFARRRPGPAAAVLFGAAAGIALAGSAALIKVCSDLAAVGPFHLFAGWQLYALLVVGGTALLLSQLAYRSGPMVASVPAINTVNPLASVIIGTAVFDEHFRVGLGPVSVETLSLILVLGATLVLSRRSALDDREGSRPEGTGS